MSKELSEFNRRVLTAELQVTAGMRSDEPFPSHLERRVEPTVPAHEQTAARLLEFGRGTVPQLVSKRPRTRLPRLTADVIFFRKK